MPVQGKNGNYRIIVELPPTGKKRNRHQERFHGTKKEADRRFRELKTLLDQGNFVDRSRVTLGAYMLQWLEKEVRIAKKFNTYKSYRDQYRNLCRHDIQHIPIQSLTTDDIQTVIAALIKKSATKDGGLSTGSIRNFLRVLSNCLNRAVKTHRIPNNPALDVVIPKVVRNERNIWSDADVKQFLQYIKSDAYPINERLYADAFELMLYTGLRRSEVAGLRWSAVDFEKKVLIVAKQRISKEGGGGSYLDDPKSATSRRIVDLTSNCVEMLERIKGGQILAMSEFSDPWPDDPFVISRPDGSTCRPDTFTAAFRRMVRRQGLSQTTPHGLRHTHATMLNEIGYQLPEIMQRLGHSSVELTKQTYVHIRLNQYSEKLQRLDARLKEDDND